MCLSLTSAEPLLFQQLATNLQRRESEKSASGVAVVLNEGLKAFGRLKGLNSQILFLGCCGAQNHSAWLMHWSSLSSR